MRVEKKKREEKHITRDASRKEDLDLNLSHQWGNKHIQKSTTPLQGMMGWYGMRWKEEREIRGRW
jgi:hypothetical protein